MPQRSLLAERDCAVVGRPWGRVVDPKCCYDARRKPHWHVLYEHDGELFVWVALKRLQDTPWHLRDEVYEPRSKVGTVFLDACLLETHLGSTDFFEGKVFSLVRDEEVTTTIEGTKVCLTRSNEGNTLRAARKVRGGVTGRRSMLLAPRLMRRIISVMPAQVIRVSECWMSRS